MGAGQGSFHGLLWHSQVFSWEQELWQTSNQTWDGEKGSAVWKGVASKMQFPMGVFKMGPKPSGMKNYPLLKDTLTII